MKKPITMLMIVSARGWYGRRSMEGGIVMEFNITTPALLFSAITLLMLAYTNRFLAVAGLVRQFVSIYEAKPEENIYKQIQNFKKRLMLMKYTQVFGVISFLFCVISMLLIFIKLIIVAEVIFTLSLVAMILSLFCRYMRSLSPSEP